MVYRIYVEKKPGFDVEATGLKNELTSLLGIQSLTGLRLLNRYDVEGIDEALFNQCVSTVFSEPPVDNTYDALPQFEGVSFAVEYLPGQFDQRADSAAECIQLISQGERPLVRSARVYLLQGSLTEAQVEEIKKYVINPVEAREASLDTKQTLKMEYPVPAPVKVLEGFNQLDEAGLAKFIEEKGLAMDLGDIKFCQEYFRTEQRDPTITEIKMIDTYWSDHCRHTTFGTILDDVQIDDAVVQEAFDRYMAMREDLGRTKKPRCMMDLATIGAKELKKQGVWVFGTAADGGTTLYEADLKGPAAIVIGSEGTGMTRLAAESCDFLVSIPMKGRISSLNASAAAAILLYEAVRQRG